MFKFSRSRVLAVFLASLMLAFMGVGNALAATPSASDVVAPSIQSDQGDYAPGATVLLTGAGWQPGEAVHLYVNDDSGRTWDRSSDVTAADDGTITDTFTLPDWFVATYKVTATGAVSGVVTTTFTDGNVQLHVSPAAVPVTFTATPYATTDCSGTAGTPTQVAPESNVSSAKSTSARLHAPSSATSSGTAYTFDSWSFTVGNRSDATYTTISGSSDICVTGFDSGRADATANYTGQPTTVSTTTTVASDNNPSTYGGAVTYTATVTGATNPSAGSVTFTDGSSTVCDSVPLSGNNQATCKTSALGAGSHTITATYNPASGYLTSNGTVTQTVNQLAVTGSITASDKPYDGGTTASVTTKLVTPVAGDDVTLTGTATFSDPNVGNAKTVTLDKPALSGQAAGNYTLANTAAITTTANITPYGLTASFTAANKTYDGTTDATLTGASVTGVKQGDTVTVTPSGKAVFADANVANGLTVTAPASSFTLGGGSAGNYSIATVTPTTANITPLHVTGAFTASDKTYDGTAAATVTGRSLVGAVTGDDVSLSGGSATFPDKNAGDKRVVTLAGASLAGAAKGDYILDSVATAKASITPLDVSATFATDNKVYDGNASAALNNPTLHGILGTDQVTISGGTATFNNKNVGTAKPVTAGPGTFTLSGTDASNYTLASVTSTSANITVRGVTVAFSAADKTYDGNNSATVSSAAPYNAVTGDNLSVDSASATAAFDGASVGSHSVSATGFRLTGDDAGNYTIAAVNPTTASIDARHVTAAFTVANKVYDGTRDSTVTGSEFTNLVTGDVVNLTGNATFDDKTVGTGKTVTLNNAGLAGASAANYVLDSVGTTTANITAAGLTPSITVSDKVYDGTTSATILTRSLDGVSLHDDVELTGGAASFADKNVGNGKTVTAPASTFTLSGKDAGNYSLGTRDVTTTANITPLDLTVEFSTPDKVYDGTAAGTVGAATPVGVLENDTVDVDRTGATATFTGRTVGSWQVNGSGFKLSGVDAGNYAIGSVEATTANIRRATITPSFTSEDKPYDGSARAAVDNLKLGGVVSGDEVTLPDATATFDSKNAGPDKTVTLQPGSLQGADAFNYALSSEAVTATATITPKGITGSFTAANKGYDGTTGATVIRRSLNGTIDADEVFLTGGTASFGDKNAGTSKTVTLDGATLDGADAGNYDLTGVGTAKADITPATITPSFTSPNKVYDGSSSAAVEHLVLGGVIGADVVNLPDASASFGSKDVGSGKVVTLDPGGLQGSAAGNYVLDSRAVTTTASITQKPITGSFTAANKIYDGTTDATVTSRSLDGTVDGDKISLTGGTATFATKDVGRGKTVALKGSILDGADAGNYALTSVATTTASISKRDLTIGFGADGKVYDGGTAAAINGAAAVNPVQGDVVGVDYFNASAAFADKNVGAGKAVTADKAGFSLTGADAGNYTIATVQDTTASITPLGVAGSFKSADKVYDGTSSAAAADRALSGVLGNDDVALIGGTASFADKNVGKGKTVTLNDATLNGADAGNYTLTSAPTTTASISKRDLTIGFGADGKVYDGGTAAAINGAAAVNPVQGDVVGVDYFNASAAFADKNVGAGKAVTADKAGFSLTGADAGNYTIATVQDTTASITPLGVAGSFKSADKVWDGTTAATITSRTLTGVLGNDDVRMIGGSATFSDANVGVSKVVTGTGFQLSGNDAGNYQLMSVPTTTASINPLYSGTGFYAPVNMSTTSTRIWNTIKGGQTVPLKFEIFNAASGAEQTSLSVFGADATAQARAFSTQSVSCITGEASSTDPVEITTTGGTSLRYDSTAGQYIQNWKTPTTVGSCYAVTVKTVDGTTVGPAYFKITK